MLAELTDKHPSCTQAAWQQHALTMQKGRWCDLAADMAADVDILAICATGKLSELHLPHTSQLAQSQSQLQPVCMHHAGPTMPPCVYVDIY